MPNESINVIGVHNADLDNLKTIIMPISTGPTGALVDVGTSSTANTKLIEFTSIMISNPTDDPIEFELFYNASYTNTTGLIYNIVVSPRENVVLCKKTQKLYGSTRNFYALGSSTGLIGTFSYKEYSI